jgi:hypothetical protein
MKLRAVLHLILVCAASAAGCRDVNGLGATGGRGTESLGPGAPIDAYESPRRDSALAIDAALSDAARSDGAGDAGGSNEQACNACEAAQCRDVDGLDLYAMCFLTTARAGEGPGAGMLKADLCEAVLHCARATGCAASDPQPCYCGPGVGDLQCLSGAAAGACKVEIEIAAESANAGVIASRLADPDFASGAAFNLLRYCERPICHDACTGGSLPPDAGVPPDATSPPDASDAGVLDGRPVDAAPDAPPAPCADLDHDGVPDCRETRVGNARFDHDAASWTAEFGATVAWDGGHDGLGDATSGSMIATNNVVTSTPGTTMVGASQCIAVLPGASYHAAAQILLAAGQGAGSAGLGAYFYAAAGCSGPIAGVWSSDLTSSTGAWTAIGGSLVVPAGAHAMAVRLVAVKPFSAPAFQAHFDNVLVETP